MVSPVKRHRGGATTLSLLPCKRSAAGEVDRALSRESEGANPTRCAIRFRDRAMSSGVIVEFS